MFAYSKVKEEGKSRTGRSRTRAGSGGVPAQAQAQAQRKSSLGRLGRRRGGVAGMQNGGNNATKEINLKFHHKRENEIT